MSKKLTIGLFGYGVVGTGLYDVLHKSKTVDATIKKIVVLQCSLFSLFFPIFSPLLSYLYLKSHVVPQIPSTSKKGRRDSRSGYNYSPGL